ncbi:MAG: methyltransferase domain-containing protein [Candidatus Lokiarchaeota archaeon]|nr:methyltransferase domain-containing protein [Candidatus Lokiarchaeota archaeon]
MNIRCPYCDSLERHRLLWLYLKYRTDLFEDNKSTRKVLHFSPTHIFQEKLTNFPQIEYFSADLEVSRADIQVDITRIPSKDNFFDVILCIHVLEHVPNDQQAMKELYRILKPGGWAIIQSPLNEMLEKTLEASWISSPRKRVKYFRHSNHVRIYGQDYKERLEKAGFKVKVDKFARDLKPAIIEKFVLIPSEEIFFCEKSK